MLTGFFGTLIIGRAILDRALRFQTIDNSLAGMHGIPVEAHLGRPARHILGDVGALVEPVLYRVLRTGKPRLNVEVTGMLPTRTEVGHWIWNCLPTPTSAGDIEQIGVVVIEITPHRKMGEMLLSAFLHQHIPRFQHKTAKIRDAATLVRSSLALTTPNAILKNLGLRPFEKNTINTLTFDEVCRAHIIRVLREANGRMSGPHGAAAKLGLKRTTLQSKLHKLKISHEDYA